MLLTFQFLPFMGIAENAVMGACQAKASKESVLYDRKLNGRRATPELQLNNAGVYRKNGLDIVQKDSLVKLNLFYALAERVVRYRVSFSDDAIAQFRSSLGDFKLCVDVPRQRMSLATNPATEVQVPFLQGGRDYLIEIYHIYQKAKVCITDVRTKQHVEMSAVHDGTGGCGAGALQQGFSVGMQWDYYCFGLVSGTSFSVKRITVSALKRHVKVLLYGDSITQPEGYYPTSTFPESWTQLIIERLKGDAMSSGRGGGNIVMLSEFIRNELPYIKAKYVVVTIGTNGGNTEENLTELVRYIRSQGAIPILNNIPCNESGTHISNNAIIERVRSKEGVNGCRFDLATSLAGDGKEVDKSLMFWEDYTGSYGWQIYHHPNEKGALRMYRQTFVDIPEIYQ
ncbi:SGNH/GDSL hydrolase family protein [Hoylesella buccalis]|nr:SGNH/GDSL hydrolase family protein [Hoylesella buccalis]